MNTDHSLISRREAIARAALFSAAGAASLATLGAQAAPAAPAAPTGPFKLAPLPYPADALEPHVDARTMEIHHGKHHAAYVANLNRAVAEAPELAGKSIEEIVRHLDRVPEKVRTTVRNNGGGHLNHELFWQMMKKGGGGEPKGELAAAIAGKFGSFGAFKDEFTKTALGQFGSGWAWLSWDAGQLRVEGTPNQDSPLSYGRVPLLGIDVWEHAYYLKYQNRRADYVAAWFNVVNWDFVAERFARAKA
ncbi:MAG: superoxide dismutase [Verrucomicrobia bacterium]|jgi:Fe-Mn family superoxide dismutase|nr:superoxide dismutase [Verrucomicrobiota bacterium]